MKLIYFNILIESRFPILISLFLNGFFFSLIIFLKMKIIYLLLINILFCFFCLLIWIKNVFVESLLGNHSFYIQDGFKICFYYFLFSELILFFRLFWFYFDASLVPLEEVGEIWLPKGLFIVNPFRLPFFNSLILLRRAISLTWVHYGFLYILKKNIFFFITLLLGLLFLLIQLFEYKTIRFSFSDSVFGNLFYLITGFHGFHVFLGLIFLLINFFLLTRNLLTLNHHLSFEFSIIYWHFVDVIWLYLFIFLYWWSFLSLLYLVFFIVNKKVFLILIYFIRIFFFQIKG